MVVGVLLDANETTVFGAYMYYLQFFPSPILIDIKFRSSYGYQNRMPDWIFLLNYQGFMHMHSSLKEQENSQIKVWDIGVRIFHWALVLFFTIAYISEDIELIHVYAGYVVLGLILFRVLWGLIGTKYARFNNFIYGKKAVIVYLKSLVTKKPEYYTGHNPIAGWMTIALLMIIFLVAWTGLQLYADAGKGPLADINVEQISETYADDDREQSESIWEEIHESLANLTLFLIFVHVAGVLLSSLIHRENLIKSMITGYKSRDND